MQELQRMYLLNGSLYTVTDNPTTPANDFKGTAAKNADGSEPEAKPEKAVSSANSVSSNMSIFTLQKINGTTKFIGGGLGLLLFGFGLHRLRRLRRNT
jgi:hypothetical protein